MDLALAGRGFVLGFAIAAAVGPITLLVIRRTLAGGWLLGMASGLGVASVDAFYGGVAVFGLTAISDPLVGLARPLSLVGGAFLVLVGLRTALSSPVDVASSPAPSRRGLAGAYLSIVGLTLTNPLTIVLFAALAVSMGVSGGTQGAALMTLGFGLGSLAWWLLLVSGVAAVRTRISARLLRAISVASGIAIAGFGALTLIHGLTG